MNSGAVTAMGGPPLAAQIRMDRVRPLEGYEYTR